MPNKLEFEGIALLVLVLVFAAMAGAIHHYRAEVLVITAQFESFKDKTAALGEQARADKLEKEKLYADNIAAANADRSDALNRLSVAQAAANTRSRPSGNNPVAPVGSSKICFDSPTYNAAFRDFGLALDQFIQDARGYAYEGDRAQIDAMALLKAWPQLPEKAK